MGRWSRVSPPVAPIFERPVTPVRLWLFSPRVRTRHSARSREASWLWRRNDDRRSIFQYMRAHAVDERDSTWEDNEPVFRVYLFRGGEHPNSSWTTWTYDVEDADLIEVAQWAQHEVGDTGLYAVALVSHVTDLHDGIRRKGLVWLIGNDANGEPQTPREAAVQERMRALRGKHIRVD